MRNTLTSLRRAAVLGIIFTMALCATAAADGPQAGEVRFAQEAKSSFDRFTTEPSGERQAWMREHYHRMRTYAPYFDARLSWYSKAWSYKDSYGIYKDDAATQKDHPEWLLKDGQGTKLYIPWGCDGGTCPLFAGDIGNPAFRANWINEARASMAPGYKGLFVDDVNMEFRVANGNGDQVAPTNPRTGNPMTAAEWRRYMADFMQEIRAAFPDKEIVHNAIWFAGRNDPDVKRQLLAADVINLERGVVDGGITSGGGQFGYETYLEQIDWLHSHGKAVTLDSYADDRESAEYNLASYFLVNGASDTFRTDWRTTPEDWWGGYDVSLGAPRGRRYADGGLVRRDFERGYAVVNQPGRPAVTIKTPGATGPDGAPRESIRLAGGKGAVILDKAPANERPGAPAGVSLVPVPNPIRSAVPGLGGSTPPAQAQRTAPRSSRPAQGRLRRSVLVRGSVRRARGGRVLVEIRRRQGGRWVPVRTARVRVGGNGRFTRLFTNLRRGRYSARGRYLEAPKRLRVASRTFSIRR